MKKKHESGGLGLFRPFTFKLLRVMKITVMLVCFVGLLSSFGKSYSQNAKLSLDFKNSSIENVLNYIESRTEYSFMYDNQKINIDREVSINVKNETVESILNQLFENVANYQMIGKHIIITPKENQFTTITQQQKSISGHVTDSAGTPLPGVSVVVKGTTTGVISDSEGNFSLPKISSNSTIVFSFVGMKSQELKINGKLSLNVILQQEIVGLDEVVAVGYGSMRKSDLTGSVNRAKIENFRETPNVTIAQSLHGSVPGLTIGQVDEAGENPTMEIRGRTTLSGNRSVLIILDGIMYSGELSDLNPNDIESVDILKDASSKAIYGANAANGVLLIKSKQGKKSTKPIFNYRGSFATQDPTSKLTLQNREQNIQRIYDMAWKKVNQGPDYTSLKPGIELEDTGVFQSFLNMINEGKEYNWWKKATNPGYIQSHNLSVQENKNDFSYFISGDYTKQKGFIVNDKFERIGLRINLTSKILDWFEIGTQTFGSFSDFSGYSPDLNNIRVMSPVTVPYDDNEEIIINPMGDVITNPFIPNLANDFDKRNNIFSNFFTSIDLPFVKGLNYRLNFGNNYAWDRHYYSSEYVGQTKSGQAFKGNSTLYDYTLDNILSYVRTFQKHRVNLTLLSGIRKVNYESTKASANTFSSMRLGYNNLSLGEIKETTSSAWKESYSYQMARMNYDYSSKYFITATIRKDGFSGFSENNKIALFPSVGLGWALNKEKFCDLSWCEQFKLRASYGVNGNLTSRYSSLAKINQYAAYIFGDGGSTLYGQEVSSLSNPNLGWEKTGGYNYGLDFSFLKNRLSGNFEYYNSETTDLLFNVNIPQITGFSQIATNLGKISNNGFELQLNLKLINANDFKWNIDFNISSNKNKIKSLVGLDSNKDGIEDDLVASNLFIGKPIGAIYTYESDGIFQIGDDVPAGFNVGTHRILDKNDDTFIDPNDRVIIGHTESAYQFGIMNEMKYRDFTLKFFINSIQGGKDGYLGSMGLPGDWYDFDNSTRMNFYNVNYWTPNNPSGKYDIPGTPTKVPYQYYESRSFVRLQDISLTYNITPKLINKMGFQSGSIFLSGQNLLTLTKWDGWDPETGAGIGRGNRPVLKGLSIGIDFSF